MPRQTLAQISALLGDRLDKLDVLTDRLSQMETRLSVMSGDLTHLRGTFDAVASQMNGETGIDKRVRLLEEGRAALQFVSHPVFVGIAVLVIGGLTTNAFTSWRDLALVRENMTTVLLATHDQSDRIRKLEAQAAYYHGVTTP